MSLMGIDIGSSRCKVAVYGENGTLITSSEASYEVKRGEKGTFELDSFLVEKALYSAIKASSDMSTWPAIYSHDSIQAISVGSFGEAVVPLDKNGSILGPSIFSHDQRRKEVISRFYEMGSEEFYKINGNILGYSYTYPKLVWYKENAPELYSNIWKVLSWADFLVFRLSGVDATNFCHANRTLLFDLLKEDWSMELLDLGGLERNILADVVPPGTVMGTILADMAHSLGLNKDVKIIVGGHDQCLNALGAGAIKGGDSVTGIGTVECTTVIFDSIPEMKVLFDLNLGIEHHVIRGKYVSFIHNQAGALQTWFLQAYARELQEKGLSEKEILDYLTLEAPSSPSPLIFLPFIEPSGAPLFLPSGNGAFFGIHATTKRGEMYRALLEGETMFFLEAFKALEEKGISINEILTTGGGSRSDFWLQIKADMLQRPVKRAKYRESGTAGAAMIAGIATNIYASVEQATEVFSGTEESFTPNPLHAPLYKKLEERYRTLMKAILL